MNELLNTQLGEILRNLRMKRGLTVREVAARLHKSPSAISAHENGKVSIYIEQLIEYCHMYGATPSEVLKMLKF